jgi:hypothetical protein
MANKIGSVLATQGLLTDVDTAQRNPLGTKAQDENSNEYIYLPGVASLAAGDWVMYNLASYFPARLLNDAGLAAGGLVAVAMSAVTANTSFGWYQVAGLVASPVNIATTANTQGALYRTGTAGRASITAVAKDAIFGAFLAGASVANVGTASIQYPFVMDQSVL